MFSKVSNDHNILQPSFPAGVILEGLRLGVLVEGDEAA